MTPIHGTILNSDTGNPIEGAHIALDVMFEGAFSPLGEGTISDAEGAYNFTAAVWPGLKMQVSHISYQSRVLDAEFAPLAGHSAWNIVLEPKSHPVTEITVNGTVASFDWKPLAFILFGAALLTLLVKSEG